MHICKKSSNFAADFGECGVSTSVVHRLPKPRRRVRFPYTALRVSRSIAPARVRKVRAAQSTIAVNGRQAVMFGPCYRDERCETSILWAAIPSKPMFERCSRESEGRKRQINDRRPQGYRTRLIGLLFPLGETLNC